MTDQMKELMNEMVQEVKSLKDLTKKELPEIAKEFIAYKIMEYFVYSIVTFVVFLIGVYLIQCGLSHSELNEYGMHSGDYYFQIVLGSVLSILFSMFFVCNFLGILEYKYQPRRMAIKAITSLFPNMDKR